MSPSVPIPAAAAQPVVIARAAVEAVRRGHPWVWREALLRGRGRGETLVTGADVQVVGEDGAHFGRGVADASSPIAIRMWTAGRAPIDAALIASRVAAAMALRARLFGDGNTTAYRVLHGEGDRMPGYVVDRYGPVAVLRIDGDAALARIDTLVPTLWNALRDAGVSTLVHRSATKGAAKPEHATLRGEAPPDVIEVKEHGMPFVVDLARGQKTGAFLDQRENRRRVGELASGRRVLNLFSYAGGFSVAAALGGARHVTSVDVAANAHATAQASFRLAGIDPRQHVFAAADAFAFLERAKREGKTWDLVVSDPPSFAPSEKARARALAAYRTLHRACVDVLATDGIFCAASCSSHVDATAFVATLDDAALGTDRLRLLEIFGPPSDHPTIAGWPEGRYLKFAVLA
jgi:23S rRNA (cytosine1962-C5)-methyltransferase